MYTRSSNAEFYSVMNNATIINTFNIDNINTAYTQTKHHQIITTIAYRILKPEPVAKRLYIFYYYLF